MITIFDYIKENTTRVNRNSWVNNFVAEWIESYFWHLEHGYNYTLHEIPHNDIPF